MRRIIQVVIAALMLASLVSCTSAQTTSPTATPAVSQSAAETPAPAKEFNTVDGNYPWNDPSVADTSDLPTWTGKQQKLIWWLGHGFTLEPETALKDVVTPEMTRVTGVEIDYENSYCNGEADSFDVKLSLLAGTKDWPSICTDAQLIKKLVDAGVIYDLTDLVPKYCPNLMKMFGPDDPVFKSIWSKPYVTGGQDGKVFGLPIEVKADFSLLKDKFAITPDPKYLAAFAPPQDVGFSCIKVRDDILKKIFPTAKTMDEIEALYMKNGTFTREDVYDVPIKSMDDFVKFLRDIKALDMKEGNLPVYPTYAYSGYDNYPLGERLGGVLMGFGRNLDCFTYWDGIDKKVKFTYAEPWFREYWLAFNRLIREGVIPKESLVDDDTAYQAKMNNGQYAVTYAEWRWPDETVLKQANKPYRYRPVFFDIPINTAKFPQDMAPPNVNNLVIFKDKVAEEDVPQILMWADYQMSTCYDKLKYWGPRSAGLFDEANGKRVFKDKTLENAMLTDSDPATLMSYNLMDGFGYMNNTVNTSYKPRRLNIVQPWMVTYNVPYMNYDTTADRKPTDALSYFKSGMVSTIDTKLTNLPGIWMFASTVPGVQKMWAARKTWEDALLKTLAANSDAEFNQLYDDFLKTAEDIGLTADTLIAINEDFAKQNAPFMDNLLK